MDESGRAYYVKERKPYYWFCRSDVLFFFLMFFGLSKAPLRDYVDLIFHVF